MRGRLLRLDLLAVSPEGHDRRVEEDRGRHGLDEDILEAAVLGLLEHLFAAIGGDHDQVGRHLSGQRQDALAGLDAVKAGHLPVDESNLVAFAERRSLTHHVDALLRRRPPHPR